MTEDIKFSEILDVLTAVHTEMPDLRFGEVVQNAVDIAHGERNKNMSGISSKKMLDSLYYYYEREKKKRGLE
jgi:hypothetical protein